MTENTDLMRKLIEEVKELKDENKKLKRQNLVVGVRWYGHGSCNLPLSLPVSGKSSLYLSGYGDKGVLDYALWLKIQGTEIVKKGVIVRDDSVLEELFISEDAAPNDGVKSPNAFTDLEIESLLGAKRELKTKLKDITYFHTVARFLRIAKETKMDKDGDLMTLLKNAYHRLEVRFRYDLLDKWDLLNIAESAGISTVGVSTEDLKEKLIKRELATVQEG